MIKIQKILYMFFLLLLFAGCTPYSSLGESEGSLGPPGEGPYCGVKNGKDVNTINPIIYRDELGNAFTIYVKEVGEGSIGSNLTLNAAGDGFGDLIYQIRKLEVERINLLLNKKSINLELLKATEQSSVNYLLYDPSLGKVISKITTSFKDLIKGVAASLNGLTIKEFIGATCLTYTATDKKNYYIKIPIVINKK